MQAWQWLILALPAILLVVSIVMIVRILISGNSAAAEPEAYAEPGLPTDAQAFSDLPDDDEAEWRRPAGESGDALDDLLGEVEDDAEVEETPRHAAS